MPQTSTKASTRASIPFEQMEDRDLAGLWRVPVGGFRWIDSDMGPLLVAVDGEPILMTQYAVLRRPRVLSDFVQLAATFSEERVVAYANKHGGLGLLSGPDPVTVGEALETWRAEAAALHELWEVWQAIEREDEEWLAARIRWTSSAVEYRPPGEDGELIAAPTYRADLLAGFTRGDVVGPARYYLFRKVNDKLRGHVNRTALPFRGGQIRDFPDGLLAAIYIHFQHALTGIRLQKRCKRKNCPEMVDVTRPNKLYHSSSCRTMAWKARRPFANTATNNQAQREASKRKP